MSPAAQQLTCVPLLNTRHSDAVALLGSDRTFTISYHSCMGAGHAVLLRLDAPCYPRRADLHARPTHDALNAVTSTAASGQGGGGAARLHLPPADRPPAQQPARAAGRARARQAVPHAASMAAQEVRTQRAARRLMTGTLRAAHFSGRTAGCGPLNHVTPRCCVPERPAQG